MATRIQLRRGTIAEWTATSPEPVLAIGEPAFETDTGVLRIGDGVTEYFSLPTVNGSARPAVSVPADSTSAGSVGDFALDGDYVYFYTGDGSTHSWLKIRGATEF